MSLTLIVDGREQTQAILRALQQTQFHWDQLIVFAHQPAPITLAIPIQWLLPPFTTLPNITSDWVGFIPQGAAIPQTLPELSHLPALIPWVEPIDFPPETAIEVRHPFAGLVSTSLLKQSFNQLAQPQPWTLAELSRLLAQDEVNVQWHSGSRTTNQDRTIKVLAIVPHYQCEPWLAQCLHALMQQTRPLDGIVVVDDASESPPRSIVEQFPQVTLLAAPHHVGPYRLVQQVIELTDYDAYLFQDADDWSSVDRLEVLLNLMVQSEAELVGTQEIRLYEPEGWFSRTYYPLDVNAALANKPGHPLLHPTSLVKRDLVMRLGGFATGLRFGGDTEFLLRAHWVATIQNSPQFCYCRRKRPGSLTTAAATGLESPARLALTQQLKQRAYANQATFAVGYAPDLTPLATAEPIELKYLTGPSPVEMRFIASLRD